MPPPIEFTEDIAKREGVSPEEGEHKYGDVRFADERNKKYPIDTADHVRAAWNYINKPDNAAKYGAEDLATIKRKIIAAWKKLIDEEGPPSARRDAGVEVRRFDVLERLDAPRLLPTGWLRASAHISRVGIQEYRRGDGSMQREFRPPETVFDAEALESFAMVPVTDGHPAEGLLTAENTGRYQRGHLSENVQAAGDRVRASLLVTDAELVRSILGGKQELSCGYTCELDPTPGEWQGKHYDAVQRKVRGNHVAVVQRGRAGSSVRLQLDSADAVSIGGDRDDEHAPGEQPHSAEEQTVKIKIDGVEYEVSEQAAQAVGKLQAKTDQALGEFGKSEKTLREQVAAEKGRADALDAKLKEAEKARADAADPKHVAEAVKARVALLAQARKVLDAKEAEKLDEQDDLGIRKVVLAKLAPSVKLDGQEEPYIRAAYDVAIATAGEAGVAAARAAGGPPPTRTDGEQRIDAAESRKKMLAELEQRHRPDKPAAA
jgi:hypothetical protein